MCAEMEWDDEADVVCTGAGVAGLATAISAVDEDGDVLVAERPAEVPDRSWWPLDCADPETMSYLAELTADLDITRLDPRQDVLPVRAIAPAPIKARDTVPPFVGSRMRDWAAQCISSPTGYLYTRVTDWPSATVALSGGESWEIVELGTAPIDHGDPVAAVHKWLSAEADARDVDRVSVTGVQRLVFDGGAVVGVVFGTDDGPYAVRARHGVLVCPQIQTTGRTSARVADSASLRVALVGRAGSRFGRVELLDGPTGAETY